MGETRETSRDKMCRWLSPQGIVTPLWIPGVWVMVTFHLAEMTVEHIIHSTHLRVGCLIETCALSPTSTHGTVDTIPGLSRGEKDDVTPQYGPYGCRSGVTMAPAISMDVTFSLIPFKLPWPWSVSVAHLKIHWCLITNVISTYQGTCMQHVISLCCSIVRGNDFGKESLFASCSEETGSKKTAHKA